MMYTLISQYCVEMSVARLKAQLHRMGSKSSKYYESLRRVRPFVEFANERILCFQKEVERQSVQLSDKEVVLSALTDCIKKLCEILYTEEGYEIYCQERDSMRTMKDDLCVLKDCIEDYTVEDSSTDAQRMMASRIATELQNLREFMKWIDAKTERKFWLAQVVFYLRTLLKIATFISATTAVILPELAGPIATLTFTTFAGVLDILDEIFLKGQRPEFSKPQAAIMTKH